VEAARSSADSPPSGSDALLDGARGSGLLEEVPKRQRYDFEFVVGRIVFELGWRLRKPNASSSVRRALAAASSSVSLAVASAIAVEVMRDAWRRFFPGTLLEFFFLYLPTLLETVSYGARNSK